MKIGCLGWGSLVWDRDKLPVPKDWLHEGPSLPIEFTRHSTRNRITLVLTPKVKPVQGLWAPMLVTNLEQARRALAIRELRRRNPIPEDVIQRFILNSIGYWTKGESRGDYADDVGKWASGVGLDAVVWTALPPKFYNEINRIPCVDEVILFLQERQRLGESKDAEEYIRRAPRQIDTDYRKQIEEVLEWTPKD